MHYTIDEGKVYLVGDIFDKADLTINNLKEIDLENASVIFLGNALINEVNFSKFANFADSRSVELYFLKGFQDNYFNCHPHMHFIDKSCEIDIFGNKGMFIPNLAGHEDEPMIPDDFIDYGENRKKIDFIIGCGGPVLADFFKTDEEFHKNYLKHGIFTEKHKEEQSVYRKILQRYRPRRWYCGHYRMSRQTKFVWDNWSDDGVINLRILNVGEISRIA